MVDDGRCRSVSTINRRRWKPFRFSPDRNRQSRRCNSWDTRHIGWDPQKLLLFDCATDTYWHFHCNGTQQSILLQFCCKRQHSYLAVILPPPPWRKSKLLDGRWRMMKGVNMTLLGFVLFHLLPRHAHVLVDLFGSARTRAPQHSPPPDPPDPAARRSPVADSAMPSYEDALTAFSEARSLLARAEDAMQHAVQMEQQKNVDLRPTQNWPTISPPLCAIVAIVIVHFAVVAVIGDIIEAQWHFEAHADLQNSGYDLQGGTAWDSLRHGAGVRWRKLEKHSEKLWPSCQPHEMHRRRCFEFPGSKLGDISQPCSRHFGDFWRLFGVLGFAPKLY